MSSIRTRLSKQEHDLVMFLRATGEIVAIDAGEFAKLMQQMRTTANRLSNLVSRISVDGVSDV